MINIFIKNFINILSEKAYAGSLSSSLSGSLGQGSLDSLDPNAESLVNLIIKISIPLGVTCAILLLVYAGYMMITSQGNPDKLQESREVITNTIIGFVVVILAVTILYLIQDSLGLSF